jgi:hypothetical protein
MADDNDNDDSEEEEHEESSPAGTTHVTRHRTKKKSSNDFLGLKGDPILWGTAVTGAFLGIASVYKQFVEPYIQNMQQQQLEEQRRQYYMQQQQVEAQRREAQRIEDENRMIEEKKSSRVKGAATPVDKDEEVEDELTFSNNREGKTPRRIANDNEYVQQTKTGITGEMEERNKQKAAIMKKKQKTSPFGQHIGNLNL